ncbi:MAG: Nre family DNA repair protein [Candidatus Bathyarchaeia archaeon]
MNLTSSSQVPICVLCKGGRMLCGKSRCPIIAKAFSLTKCYKLIDSETIYGSSPPGVFVGWVGYPKVSVGPLIPPQQGDTKILDFPEMWIGKTIDEIIDFRSMLIRGKVLTNINAALNADKFLSSLQELAMSCSSVDALAIFKKKPKGTIVLSDETQPFGPSAPLKHLELGNPSVNQKIEKAYFDKDLKAFEAVITLYKAGEPVTSIQKCFSLGMFGLSFKRKLVPTRWSITAVDDAISKHLVNELKNFETINEYQVYVFKNLDNIFLAVLMPEKWSFEWIEAWFPGTAWNKNGGKPALMGDYESYKGRFEYASVGGCYYAARLAVAEKLFKERKQASALILREIHPGYILPVGVWNVRESVRKALLTKPQLFDSLEKSLKYAEKHLTIKISDWIASSVMLKQMLHQKKLIKFF